MWFFVTHIVYIIGVEIGYRVSYVHYRHHHRRTIIRARLRACFAGTARHILHGSFKWNCRGVECLWRRRHFLRCHFVCFSIRAGNTQCTYISIWSHAVQLLRGLRDCTFARLFCFPPKIERVQRRCVWCGCRKIVYLNQKPLRALSESLSRSLVGNGGDILRFQ